MENIVAKTLENILMSDKPRESIINNFDVLMEIIPELRNMVGFDHKHPHHHLDVWNHTLLAVSLSDADYVTRISLLLHDIGKPFCFQEGDVRHFKGHADFSCLMSREILERLGYDDDFTYGVSELIRLHDTPISDEQIVCDRDFCSKLFEIQYCDALAHNPEKLEKRILYLKDVSRKLNISMDKEYIKK